MDIDERIVKNSIRCKHCDDIIESKHRHHYISCKCGKVSADGGAAYLRRTFPKSPLEDHYEDLSIIVSKKAEEIAEKIFENIREDCVMGEEWLEKLLSEESEEIVLGWAIIISKEFAKVEEEKVMMKSRMDYSVEKYAKILMLQDDIKKCVQQLVMKCDEL